MKLLLSKPLLLTLIVGCSSKDKTFIERRDNCANVFRPHQVSFFDMNGDNKADMVYQGDGNEI